MRHSILVEFLPGKILFGCIVLLLIHSCVNKERSYQEPSNNSMPPIAKIQEDENIEISRMLVGTNVWYIDPSHEVWELIKTSGVSSLRIGGHAYDRKIPGKDQLKSWVKRIQDMGAEPILQVSQYDPPENAAELVRYFNVDLTTGKPIKYWNIGNEPWLQNGKPELSEVGSMVESYFKPIAKAMKEIDSNIKIYGPDLCYYMDEAINDLFGGKNDISGKIPGKAYYFCDGISWHRYPQDQNINLAYEGIEDFKSSIIKCKAKVDEINTKHNRKEDNVLGWGIGEYNAKGGPQVHTWENGQMFAGILDLCMKYEATYAASWSMFENSGNRKGTDFSLIDGKNMTPRPSYRHIEMIANNFTGYYAEGNSSLSDIITFGSYEGSKVSVMIMNRAKDLKIYNLSLKNADTIAHENLLKLNINANSNLIYTDSIDGLSTQTLVFENDKLLKTTYSSTFFENELPPKTVEINLK
ncbi:glycoside hydrolase family 44 protein [Aestuariivivens sediminis]|uniref:glycoside hydrolase family 44 protein n=1 Tax=Aestuariivivens sediminis TaxID=2913557 RepID=UPI001F57AD89|nr:glycoside hydrolase family 44 protein [Aestuariivivens sediminis]